MKTRMCECVRAHVWMMHTGKKTKKRERLCIMSQGELGGGPKVVLRVQTEACGLIGFNNKLI